MSGKIIEDYNQSKIIKTFKRQSLTNLMNSVFKYVCLKQELKKLFIFQVLYPVILTRLGVVAELFSYLDPPLHVSLLDLPSQVSYLLPCLIWTHAYTCHY